MAEQSNENDDRDQTPSIQRTIERMKYSLSLITKIGVITHGRDRAVGRRLFPHNSRRTVRAGAKIDRVTPRERRDAAE